VGAGGGKWWPIVKYTDCHELCKNSCANRDAVWDAEWGGSREPCIR